MERRVNQDGLGFIARCLGNRHPVRSYDYNVSSYRCFSAQLTLFAAVTKDAFRPWGSLSEARNDRLEFIPRV